MTNLTAKEEIITRLMLAAPVPSGEEIERQVGYDMSCNFYGDSYKPKRRSEMEIITEHKIAWVQAHYEAIYQVCKLT